MTYKKTVAVLEGVCTVEEAEDLLIWLQNRPRAKVNLKRCTHLHAALLQVLMATGVPVSAWPEDPGLRVWLEVALSSHRCAGQGWEGGGQRGGPKKRAAMGPASGEGSASV